MAGKVRTRLGIKPETPRVGSRQIVALAGTCRVTGEEALPVSVLDLDAHGCRLRGLVLGVSKRDELALTIGPVGPITGQLRWFRNMMAGIAFSEPLSADQLADALADESIETAAANVIALRRRG